MKTARPAGHRVLIRPTQVEEITKSGLVLAKSMVKQEQQAQVEGEVLALGTAAYHDYAEPWCKVGDIVLYQRFSGMKIPDGKGGFREDRLLINDLDVTGVVIDE